MKFFSRGSEGSVVHIDPTRVQMCLTSKARNLERVRIVGERDMGQASISHVKL